jgi:predicted Zn-ribbon and HTH transcriptional regulator
VLNGILRQRAIAFRAASLFLDGQTANEVYKELLCFYPQLDTVGFVPEQVYALLARAAELGMLKILPAPNLELAQRIQEQYPNVATRDIRVVDTNGLVGKRGGSGGEALSAVAADLVFELLKTMPLADDQVAGLGLGPGRATLDFSTHLSALLSADRNPPKVKLFAITAGCLPRHPELAPISFFNLFPEHLIDERIGLFAENLIPASEFGLMKTRPGVNVAFQEKHKIRIVVTAMGAMDDKDDILRMFFEEANADFEELGAIGNVQYRPFSRNGIVHERNEQLRAVTLFELRELAELSRRPDHHVVLIARRCGKCGHNRANAVRALLEVKELGVFSTLIMDRITAEAVLSD